MLSTKCSDKKISSYILNFAKGFEFDKNAGNSSKLSGLLH